jgi:transcriptional regulator with XRE-family HTH domain
MQHPRIKVDGPAIRQFRMLQGLEIADVAARAGISRSYLSRIEVNSLWLRPRTYRALCEALNHEHDSFLAPSEDRAEEEE